MLCLRGKNCVLGSSGKFSATSCRYFLLGDKNHLNQNVQQYWVKKKEKELKKKRVLNLMTYPSLPSPFVAKSYDSLVVLLCWIFLFMKFIVTVIQHRTKADMEASVWVAFACLLSFGSVSSATVRKNNKREVRRVNRVRPGMLR